MKELGQTAGFSLLLPFFPRCHFGTCFESRPHVDYDSHTKMQIQHGYAWIRPITAGLRKQKHTEPEGFEFLSLRCGLSGERKLFVGTPDKLARAELGHLTILAIDEVGETPRLTVRCVAAELPGEIRSQPKLRPWRLLSISACLFLTWCPFWGGLKGKPKGHPAHLGGIPYSEMSFEETSRGSQAEIAPPWLDLA